MSNETLAFADRERILALGESHYNGWDEHQCTTFRVEGVGKLLVHARAEVCATPRESLPELEDFTHVEIEARHPKGHALMPLAEFSPLLKSDKGIYRVGYVPLDLVLLAVAQSMGVVL